MVVGRGMHPTGSIRIHMGLFHQADGPPAWRQLQDPETPSEGTDWRRIPVDQPGVAAGRGSQSCDNSCPSPSRLPVSLNKRDRDGYGDGDILVDQPTCTLR